MLKFGAYAILLTGMGMGAFLYHLPSETIVLDSFQGNFARYFVGAALPFVAGGLLYRAICQRYYEATAFPSFKRDYLLENFIVAFGLICSGVLICAAAKISMLYSLATLIGAVGGWLIGQSGTARQYR